MVGNIERVGGYAPVLWQIFMQCAGAGVSCYAFEIFVVNAVVEVSYVSGSLTRVLQYIEGLI